MAGSLNHIVADDGTFTLDTVENMGDRAEALEECHQIIAELLETIAKGLCMGFDWNDKRAVLKLVCNRLGFPVPNRSDGRADDVPLDQVNVPIILPDLHGCASVYKPDTPKEWLIWSEEHNAWWRPGGSGYTDKMGDAGRYGFAQAHKIVTDANLSAPLPGKKFNEQMVRVPGKLL